MKQMMKLTLCAITLAILSDLWVKTGAEKAQKS